MELLLNVYPDGLVLHRSDDAHCPADEQEGQPKVDAERVRTLIENREALPCAVCLADWL